MTEREKLDLFEKIYSQMSVGEGVLTGEAALNKAANRRPKQTEFSYLQDGDVVEFGSDVNKIVNRGFGSEVPVVVTSKNGEIRGMSFFLSTFGKSFILTDKDGNLVDEHDNPTSTPVRAKTTGEPAEVYKGETNEKEAYKRFLSKKVKFSGQPHYGEKPVFENGKRVGKDVAEQTAFHTEWS